MGIVVSVISTVWPFFKEVVLGNNLLGYFFLRYRWVIIDLLATFALFLLFVNQYMVNVTLHKHYENVEKTADIKIMELSSTNSRQADKINRLDEKLADMTLSYTKLLVNQPNCLAPVPPVRTTIKASSDGIIDRSFIDRINRLGNK
jgi:hypothetical protein